MKNITLDTVAGGAILELFDSELRRVLDNITDINTDAKAARKITIELTFTSNEDRNVAAVKVKCGSKLAGIKSAITQVFVGMVKGQLVAVEHDPRQSKLFDPPPGPTHVVPMSAERGHE